MRREAEQVYAELVYVEAEGVGGLDGVGVNGDVAAQLASPLLDRASDLCHRLDDARLVVCQHDAHQHRALGYGVRGFGRVHQAVSIHGQVRDLKAELF